MYLKQKKVASLDLLRYYHYQQIAEKLTEIPRNLVVKSKVLKELRKVASFVSQILIIV